MRGLADEHRARRRGLLEPSGRVDRIAGRAVLDARASADRAEDDRPRVHADPDREAVDAPTRGDLGSVAGHLLGDPQARTDGPFRVVLMRHGRSEEREDPVPGEILDGAPERLDGGHHPGDRLPDDEPHLLGVEPLPERGRADDVGVERRHRLSLLAHRGCCAGLAHASLIAARRTSPRPLPGRGRLVRYRSGWRPVGSSTPVSGGPTAAGPAPEIDLVVQQRGYRAAGERADVVDPGIAPRARDQLGPERAGRVERAAGEWIREQHAEDEHEPDREPGDGRVCVPLVRRQREDDPDDEEGDESLDDECGADVDRVDGRRPEVRSVAVRRREDPAEQQRRENGAEQLGDQ